jgi:hypothetical protein
VSIAPEKHTRAIETPVKINANPEALTATIEGTNKVCSLARIGNILLNAANIANTPEIIWAVSMISLMFIL